MKKLICLFLLFSLRSLAVPAENKDAKTLEIIEENLLLEAEYKLTKSPSLYFIFNLRESKIYLKARGKTLKEWPVEAVRFWGDAIPLKALPLVKKSTLFAPRRENIEPGQNKDSSAVEIDALEIGDMPGSYTLSFAGGVRVYIDYRRGGLFSLIGSLGRTLKWLSAPPMLTLWYALSRSSFTAVDIVLKDKGEAGSLYWILTEGNQCILFLPRDHLLPPDPGGESKSAPKS